MMVWIEAKFHRQVYRMQVVFLIVVMVVSSVVRSEQQKTNSQAMI